MFIQFQPTPNPDALKFLPQARLAVGGPYTVERETGAPPPLAVALFEIDAVLRLMIGEDFLTVTRRPDGPSWPDLKPQVLCVLAGHVSDGAIAWSPGRGDLPPDGEIEAEIRQVVALHVRPGAQRDGGDILVERFDAATGVLWIRMQGACSGCPSSQLTLKAGVEAIVRRYVPEVTGVQAVALAREPAVGRPWRRWLDRAAPGASGGGRTVFSHNGVARAQHTTTRSRQTIEAAPGSARLLAAAEQRRRKRSRLPKPSWPQCGQGLAASRPQSPPPPGALKGLKVYI